MVTVFLILGIANLALGIVAAVLYDRWFETPQAIVRTGSVEAVEQPGDVPEPLPLQVEADEDIPADWQVTLDACGLADVPPLETILWILLRGTDDVRQQLTSIDAGPREGGGITIDVPTKDRALRTCGKWVEDLQRASSWLRAARPGELGEHLAPVLSEFTKRIETVLARSNPESAENVRLPAQSTKDIVYELLDISYKLRDQLEETLAAELVNGNRASVIPAALRVDAEAALYNRLGLEYIAECYAKERREDGHEVCVAVIEIDRFQRVMQRLGAARADALIHSFARLVEKAMRHNRGGGSGDCL
jgi:hypothetical protein